MTRKFLFGLSFIVCLGMGGQAINAMNVVMDEEKSCQSEEDEGWEDFDFAGIVARHNREEEILARYERAQDEQKNTASMYQTLAYEVLNRIPERQKSDRHAFPAWEYGKEDREEFAKQDARYKKAYAREFFKKLIQFFPMDCTVFASACDWYLQIVQDDIANHYRKSSPRSKSSSETTRRTTQDVIYRRAIRATLSCSPKKKSKQEKEKFEKIRDLVLFMVQDPKQRFTYELVQNLRVIAQNEAEKVYLLAQGR